MPVVFDPTLQLSLIMVINPDVLDSLSLNFELPLTFQSGLFSPNSIHPSAGRYYTLTGTNFFEPLTALFVLPPVGSWQCRVGWSSETEPRLVFPPVVAAPRNPKV